uniref:DUF1642 domain-containing protein n=1 Tax=Siphoviridae sp. ctlr42 TaxID=2823599 RepID=A0A8S5L5V9_9CAUD|nr:MAG TPA: Protein of unknown function DUF1642 [Siphoviridae sp. ctlr42]
MVEYSFQKRGGVMKIGDSVVLRGTIKGVTYGEYGFPHYLVTLPNGCETEFPKPYIEDLQQLDESEKVKVPQYVHKYIQEAKEYNWDLQDLMKSIDDEDSKDLQRWFYHECNQETLARAWLDGYEVEEEKRYIVRVKGVEEDNAFLNYYATRNEWFMDSSCDMKDIRAFHTRKELEDAGFGWVFSCEGIEIEEVE